MSKQQGYRAKVPCRMGGAYRAAGDFFVMPRFDKCPPCLEEVKTIKASSEPPAADAPPPAPGGTPEEMTGATGSLPGASI